MGAFPADVPSQTMLGRSAPQSPHHRWPNHRLRGQSPSPVEMVRRREPVRDAVTGSSSANHRCGLDRPNRYCARGSEPPEFRHRPSGLPCLTAWQPSVARSARRSKEAGEAAAALIGSRRPFCWPVRLPEVQRTGSEVARHDIVWNVLGAGMRCHTMSSPARPPQRLKSRGSKCWGARGRGSTPPLRWITVR